MREGEGEGKRGRVVRREIAEEGRREGEEEREGKCGDQLSIWQFCCLRKDHTGTINYHNSSVY